MSKNKKKNKGTSTRKESFSNILRESKLTALACTRRNPAGPESGLELDLPFLFIWEWNNTFANQPDFWFTFPYHQNFEPILDRFTGFVSSTLVWMQPLSYWPFGTNWSVPV